MLNPSTADASIDDPTIRRCRGFADRWECNGIVVANLYALRATNPEELWKAEDPVGPENDSWLHRLANEFDDVVCAWGSNAKQERVDEVVKIFRRYGCRLFHLGLTKSGQPKHPLYIKGDQPLIEWKDERGE